jgi:hypothetical protein
MRTFDSNQVTARLGRRNRRVGYVVAAMLALAATMLAACSEDSDSAGAAQGGDLSVSVLEPADGANVSVPFTIKVKSSVPLGPTESGRHHVHIWFDGNENEYQVVESDSLQVTNLPAGQHTVHVSLRNANHSPAGADSQSTVTVGGGGAPAATTSPPDAPTSEPPDPDYDY